jgi:hypothetical protein
MQKEERAVDKDAGERREEYWMRERREVDRTV